MFCFSQRLLQLRATSSDFVSWGWINGKSGEGRRERGEEGRRGGGKEGRRGGGEEGEQEGEKYVETMKCTPFTKQLN